MDEGLGENQNPIRIRTKDSDRDNSNSVMSIVFGGGSNTSNSNSKDSKDSKDDVDVEENSQSEASASASDLLSPVSNSGGGGGFGYGGFWSESSSWIKKRLNSANSTSSSLDRDHHVNLPRDPTLVERQNLLNITKLVIKELIEFSIKRSGGDTSLFIEADHPPLQHFFIVLEHAMRHGLRPKKGLLGPKKELWDVLQVIEKCTSGAGDITNSIRDLPTVSTHTGRARAFLRLALMQKKLADYFKVLLDVRDSVLSEYYENFSLMMSEEGVVLGGLLVGLNVVDCNFCLKEEDQLDSQQGVIDFSLYLRSTSRASDYSDEGGVVDNSVLDQKCYIEELNRHLNATVSNLQNRMETLTTTNALLSEDLSISKKTVAALQEDNSLLKSNQHQHQSQQQHPDQVDDVLKIRISELEKENSLLKSSQDEMSTAMSKLETDVHEKQDVVISLRKQLEEIKTINLEMYRKLQDCESSLKFKSELVDKLEGKVAFCDGAVLRVEEKLTSTQVDLRNALKDSRQVCIKLAEKELQLSTAETELKVEREWRMNLQDQMLKEKERLGNSIDDFKREKNKGENITKTLNMATSEINTLRKQIADQEQTLEEMGAKLKENKELLEEYREGGVNKWIRDKEAKICWTCHQPFSLVKRKHHCRSCGNIFCADCSDNVLELPSNSKPVRVCDECFCAKGISRCSVGGTGGTATGTGPGTGTGA